MQDMTGETLAPLDAWARFQALPALAQQQFLRQIYLLELRDAGRDQNEPGVGGLPRNAGFNRGYTAISTLFPGASWKGDVAANKLMLRTMAGGDISVFTPGGSLQIDALGATVPDGYGLVTLASGHIGVAAKNDVTVNRSRILSFVPEASARGSDQIIWSSDGDIDAGKGSKTVRVPSAAEVLTDLDGHTTVREKADMSGSGIGTETVPVDGARSGRGASSAPEPYDPQGAMQVLGQMKLGKDQLDQLTPTERRNLAR
ncbi:filamentous hemagglutinin family protein [Variovorax sp. LT2P21]|uniref:filamentous haemagglutinin family protein n=1 Tax=Variovorax sp. LT2P21 TaxID=3443731 RepID=UPI003F4712D7